MAAFSPATHKVVTAASANPKDDLPVDVRVMLARTFSEMGVFQVTGGNVAPSDKDVLWWHTDVKQFKRYDAVNANWYPIVANQVAMHIMRRAILGSVQDTNVEVGDLFCFWDVSLGDLKKISRSDLANALFGVRTIATNEGVQGGGDLSANRTLKLDVNGLTAKTTPADADVFPIFSVADSAHRKVTHSALKAAVRGVGTVQGIWCGDARTGAEQFSIGLTWQEYDSGTTKADFLIDGGPIGKAGAAICIGDVNARSVRITSSGGGFSISAGGAGGHVVLCFLAN